MDLFPGSTPMGQFKADPTIETLLSYAKDINSEFHNENPSWYTIENRDSFGCTLSANQTNPYYIGSFYPGYSINPTNKIELSSIFPTSQLPSALKNKIFLDGGNDNPNDALNQINDFFKEKGYGTNLSLNQITANYTTYGGEYGDGIITLSATNSLIFSGTITIPYTNIFSPTNMTSNNSPSPYVASASATYQDSTNVRWQNYLPFSNVIISNYGWCTQSTVLTGQWLQISLDKPYKLAKYQISPCDQSYINSGERLNGWAIQGSNDGTNWNSLDERSNQENTWTGMTLNTYILPTPSEVAYSKYRLLLTQENSWNSWVDLSQIKYFGTV